MNKVELYEYSDECQAPETIEFYQTPIAGNYCAQCTNCNFLSTSWECGCELEHECETNSV